MSTSKWSVPRTDVMEQIRDSLDEAAVLTTIVGVKGSAYRRPGTKMVITEGDTGVGSLTAGCLKDEVLSLAEDTRESGDVRLERFDLTADDDIWGLGIGCNGVIDIMLEPLDESYRPAVDAYEDDDDIAVLTVLDAEDAKVARGDRGYGRPTDGPTTTGSVAIEAPDWPDWLTEQLQEPVRQLVASDASETVTVTENGRTVEVFVDSITTPPHLVVFGSGHDVGPVTQLAKQVGFRVTVASFRGATATAERFPAADRVQSMSPADVGEELTFDTDTYAVVMTHNFVDDRLALEELLDIPVEYVGLLGPRKRFEEMREAFAREGRTFDEDELARIYTPIGLDLGGGTPFHIAQSIVAEVTAVHHDREPRHLTEREGPIHDRVQLSLEGE